MGRGVEIHYEACGFKKELMYGGGFLSCPDNPVMRDEILSGRYGKRPKRILDKNPDAGFYCYRPLFHCSCRNISDKDDVSIGNIKPLAGRV
ncbi:MAG: hypothetical protein E7Z63_03455 [Thermoplasmata archaeon]|nr:hypothetical protein [Thermoplasmata archaeon]